MPLAVIGLGANLGDAPASLRAALAALGPLAAGGAGIRASAFWRSAPVDAAGPDFVNAVACFPCALAPLALLDALQSIEADFGRARPYRHAPRTLDLDLLLLGELRLQTPRLVLPHPRAHLRAFVLAPLAELLPEAVIPGQGAVATLLAAVRQDRSQAVERMPPATMNVTER